LHKKLVYISYQIALCNNKSESWASFKSKFFKELISTLEAKQCGQTMFAQKFERLDTAYLDQCDIFSHFQAEQDKSP